MNFSPYPPPHRFFLDNDVPSTQYRFLFISSIGFLCQYRCIYKMTQFYLFSPPLHNFLFLLGVLYLLPLSRTVSVYFPDVCCVLWSLLYYLLNICTYISIYLSTRWHCSMSCCCCCPRANCYTHLYVNASASVGDEGVGVEVGVGGWVCPWRASAAPVLLSCHSRLAIPSPFSIPLLTPWNVSTIG